MLGPQLVTGPLHAKVHILLQQHTTPLPLLSTTLPQGLTPLLVSQHIPLPGETREQIHSPWSGQNQFTVMVVEDSTLAIHFKVLVLVLTQDLSMGLVVMHLLVKSPQCIMDHPQNHHILLGQESFLLIVIPHLQLHPLTKLHHLMVLLGK